KRLAQHVFGFTDDQVFGTQAQKEAIDPRWGISPRDALIRLGHGARVHLDDRVWIRACLAVIERQKPKVAGIADVRYPNEAEAINVHGGYGVRLRCPDAQTTVDPNAPSEKGVDEIASEFVDAEISVPRSPAAALLLEAFGDAIASILDAP